jgi:hypothetical protein
VIASSNVHIRLFRSNKPVQTLRAEKCFHRAASVRRPFSRASAALTLRPSSRSPRNVQPPHVARDPRLHCFDTSGRAGGTNKRSASLALYRRINAQGLSSVLIGVPKIQTGQGTALGQHVLQAAHVCSLQQTSRFGGSPFNLRRLRSFRANRSAEDAQWLFLMDRPGTICRTTIDSSKARRELG